MIEWDNNNIYKMIIMHQIDKYSKIFNYNKINNLHLKQLNKKVKPNNLYKLNKDNKHNNSFNKSLNPHKLKLNYNLHRILILLISSSIITSNYNN